MTDAADDVVAVLMAPVDAIVASAGFFADGAVIAVNVILDAVLLERAAGRD